MIKHLVFGKTYFIHYLDLFRSVKTKYMFRVRFGIEKKIFFASKSRTMCLKKWKNCKKIVFETLVH